MTTLLINFPVFAKNSESNGDFQKGVEYFNDANYPAALRYFTQALNQGLRSEKLHYNLGITYYKLNDYEKALAELTQAMLDPQLVSAAHFNSGLIYAKLGQLKMAQYQFQLAYTSATSEKQKTLALHGLNKIGKLSRQENVKIWSVRAEVNNGVNDNVTRTQRPGYGIGGQSYGDSIVYNADGMSVIVDSSKISDEYRMAYIIANIKLYKQINLGGSLYAQRYAKQHEYNVQQKNIHLDIRSREGGNLYLISTEFDSIRVGKKDYLDSWGVRLQGTFRVAPRAFLSSQFYVKNFTAKNNSPYRYLQGRLSHFQSKLIYRFNRLVQLGFDYRFEVNDRDDIQNTDGSTRISYSPVSNHYGIDLKVNLTNSLWIQFDRYNRIDTYPEELKRVEIDPCLPSVDPRFPCMLENFIFKRIDIRKVLVTDIVWRANRHWMFKLSYQNIEHDSNKAIQAYENMIYYLGTVVEF